MSSRSIRVAVAVVIMGLSIALIMSVRQSRVLRRELDRHGAEERRDCLLRGMDFEEYRQRDRKAYVESRSFIDGAVLHCLEHSLAVRMIEQLAAARTPAEIDAAFAAARKAIQDANSD